MKVFAPKIFYDLQNNDKKFFNLSQSFDIKKNLENIKKSSQADGGRGKNIIRLGGEFFFFSYDNKLILKTMSV